MNRIGVFGGSFNPPHLGHLAAARFFAEELRLEKLWITPANVPPLRAALRGAAGADRLRLCELTFAGDPRFAVSDLELRRAGVSYTMDTLREIQAQEPGAALFLLTGTDQLQRFTQWKDWRGILGLSTLCVLQRDAAPLALPPGLPPERVRLLHGFAPLAISATQIREQLGAGEDVSPWLAPAALHYIKEKGLFDCE
ncbi:MAG: nicotinate (nicotinamide) nucleotide adenylyltransferase [Oscillospiraceae bacterium]|jgi:nicotinate-nucleotide adenylyltransferase|nr:nicotinate (nicotinamide) nucleotide adenylyltransferase [Oscillospiraceae bacterium]